MECLQEQGILPGIKVDEGLIPIAATNSETSTRGLDSLATNSASWRRWASRRRSQRVAICCCTYRQHPQPDREKYTRRQGARFAKWRAALRVGASLPSEHALAINALQLAQYAAICQARHAPAT